jgi:hypothetical protein
VTVAEHVYDIPSDDELAQLVGAATPHFALQIRDRVAKLAAALPADHPRRASLLAHVTHLEALAFRGEAGEGVPRDLPPLPSLIPDDPAADRA